MAHRNVCPCCNLPGYVNTASYFRDKILGGGVSIFVRDNLDFTPLSIDIKPVVFSFEFAAIKSTRLETAIICICRSNNTQSDIDNFYDYFDRLLQKLSSFKYLAICGDMNIYLLKNTSHRMNFVSILNLHNIKSSVLTPTRITPTSSSCIDNIFLNFSPKLLLNNNLTNVYFGLGDHKYCQLVKFNIEKIGKTEKL